MKNLLDNGRSASVLLSIFSALTIGLALASYDKFNIFTDLLWFVSIFPIVLTVCSFILYKRLPVLFNGFTVVFGIGYSLILSRELLILLHLSDMYARRFWNDYQIPMRLRAVVAVGLVFLWLLLFVIDIVKLKTTWRGILCRLLVSIVLFLPCLCLNVAVEVLIGI